MGGQPLSQLHPLSSWRAAPTREGPHRGWMMGPLPAGWCGERTRPPFQRVIESPSSVVPEEPVAPVVPVLPVPPGWVVAPP
jgi:hypothetical protein